ncbi:MAG TPA: Asp-tRNA(Asn)/Glu-tRNA(Gln) amidotransferase subunit GatA [Candidatus Gracilibacteria bacterium]|nr:Asp-tRNA(Asn)/Glu-tRNA(Gln) amidotransferase subunit GatA [Candidatus Gracilibacteria bacterium]
MLASLTLEEAAEGLRNKKFSSTELTREINARIAKLNPGLNAYVTLTEESALKQAAAIDERFAKGESLSSLAGIPVGLKDIFNTKGVRTTCCSNIIRDFVPPYNATVVDKLEEAGMVLVGKTNMDEFACGGSTEHSCFGVTKNPWDISRVAGGSSGGSAAAVAADLAYYALGTDTGGSIRQPASLCGVVGLKVTYGRVSRSGVTAMASSWDTIGPFGKTVRDTAMILQTIAGKDRRDATTPSAPVPDYTKNIGDSIKGLKIGVPKEYFGEGIEPETEKIVREALKQYEKLGATVKEVTLPYTKYAVAVYYVAMPAELSANLARFDGIRYGSKPKAVAKDMIDYYYQTRSEGFGDEIKRRIMIGTYVLSAGYYDAYYRKAQKVRTLIIQDFENAFKDVDVLMAPVSPFPAFKIGAKKDDPLAMYLADVFTIPVSCAGVPAISLPCGFASGEGGKKLPVGLQIIGPQFSEDLLFKVGGAYEQATEWHKQKPGLA